MSQHNPVIVAVAALITVPASFVAMSVCGTIALQNKFIYAGHFPPGSRSPIQSPLTWHFIGCSLLKATDVNEHWIRASDGSRLQMFKLKFHSRTPKPISLIYFQGNTGNIVQRLPAVDRLALALNTSNPSLSLKQSQILYLHYRGYGNSQGISTQRGLEMDADAIMKYATSESTNDIFIHGHSIGGAVAIYAAQKYASHGRIKAMFLESTFTNIENVMQHHLPFVTYKIIAMLIKNELAKKILLRSSWDSSERIRQFDVPTLFICGKRDEVIPYTESKQLYSLSSSKIKELAIYDFGLHESTLDCPGCFSKLREFVSRLP